MSHDPTFSCPFLMLRRVRFSSAEDGDSVASDESTIKAQSLVGDGALGALIEIEQQPTHLDASSLPTTTTNELALSDSQQEEIDTEKKIDRKGKGRATETTNDWDTVQNVPKAVDHKDVDFQLALMMQEEEWSLFCSAFYRVLSLMNLCSVYRASSDIDDVDRFKKSDSDNNDDSGKDAPAPCAVAPVNKTVAKDSPGSAEPSSSTLAPSSSAPLHLAHSDPYELEIASTSASRETESQALVSAGGADLPEATSVEDNKDDEAS